jgi:hypothetical protein
MKQRYLIHAFLLPIVACLSACDAWQDNTRLRDEGLGKNLYETVTANPNISFFAEILQITGYDRFLQEEPALTVFAPENDALKELDRSDANKMKEWIKNYIAYLSYYTDLAGQFPVGHIRMINEKNVPVNAAGISGAHIVKANESASNGVLHVIDSSIADRKNIWEYLTEQTGYEQVDYIRSLTKQVMDMDRSVQISVLDSRPVYDTIWTTRNEWLETYPLDNETQAFTVLLLEPNTLERLKTKYAKYMQQKDPQQQEAGIMQQVTGDMVLHPVIIEQAGRYYSMEDIGVDIDPEAIVETYRASNGTVYKVNAVDVKMYENKIKTQIIEAEDYDDRWDSRDAWEVRYRSWASGGKDVLLKGTTRNKISYEAYNEETETMETKENTYTYRVTYRTNDPLSSNVSNPYLKFQPTLYSTGYEIFWVAYDDVEWHYSNFSDTIQQPMILEQKLLVSFPGEPELKRETDGAIENNFTSYSLMAGTSTAGIHEETQLVRYRASATDKIYLLGQRYSEEDDFGQNEILKSPSYGKATFFVSNTVRETNVNAGLIFLDYIRLVPKVDPND